MTGRLLQLWQRMGLWAITVEGTVTWWCGDDVRQRDRKLDVEIRWPKWIWRPYCWWRGQHDQHYAECIYCGTAMPYPEALRHAKTEPQNREA